MKKKYKKIKDDSDIMPFYFLIKIPEKGNVGVLILERKSNLGIGTIIRQHFNESFSRKFDNYSVSFSPQVSKDLYKKFITDGKVQTITLKRYGLPSDIAGRANITNLSESLSTIEIRFKAKRNKFFDFKDRKKGEPVLFDIPELSKIGFGEKEYSSQLKIKLGKSTRTIDLTETGQFRPYYDIDKEVEKETSGHPKFSSIDKIAIKLLDDIFEELLGYNDHVQ